MEKITGIVILVFLNNMNSSIAQHCVEDSWSELLQKQYEVEMWYNESATNFNQLLQNYEQQILMGEEFSTHELSSFWHPNKPELHKKLNDQIQSSIYLAELLSERVLLINEKVDTVTGLTIAWQNMNVHCLQQNFPINYQTSQSNVESSQSLKSELSQLRLKYENLGQRYLNEAHAIQISKPNQN